jgi:ATP/maltotriose-dependent transcriptional regulator MalT/DNA-binding SARP family transcriptional activator
MGKGTRPILTGIFPRKRLFGLLDRMRGRPVTWISGPPGCGKTTAVISYLDSRKLPCLWYQVDPGDADPATFFYYLGLAAKNAAPRRRKPLPLLTREYLQGIPTFTLRYFENLFDRLNPLTAPPFSKGGKKGGFVIVFDNYQEVPEDAPLHEILLNGLSRLPAGIHVLLVSRKDPPPVFIRLRANEQMEVLGWNDLRLTLEESSGIIRMRAKTRQSKESISLLHGATDGWVAGLVLMLEGARERDTGLRRFGEASPEEVFDYFASEIFDKTDREIQDFLLKTSFLPKMTPKMAEELTGLSTAGRILSGLSRTHYFTEKTFKGEAIYQYHPLFREFLLSRAKDTFSAESRSKVTTCVVEILERDGQTESAVNLLRDIDNWEGLIQLIQKHAPGLISKGRHQTLQEWLQGLPEEIFEGNPWLLYWMGICRLQTAPSQSQPYFERAFEKFHSRGETTGIVLSIWGVVHSIVYGMADFKPLDRWIPVLETLALRFKEFPSKEIELWFASAMLSALICRKPHHPDIETWIELALSLAARSSNLNLKMQTLSTMASYRVSQGDLGKADLVIDSLKELSESRDSTPLVKIRLGLIEAAYYKYIGDHPKCQKCVSDSLELSRRTGIHMFNSGLLYHGVLSALCVSDITTAERYLDEMASSLSSYSTYDLTTYHSAKTQEGLYRGDLFKALTHMELATKLRTEAGFTLITGWCHIQNAHVRHAFGKHQEAAEHLDQSIRFSRAMRSKGNEYASLLAAALFSFDQGKEEEGYFHLRDALVLGKEEGYFGTWGVLPSHMATLCTKALEAGVEVEYAQELIRRLRLIPENPPLHLESWPWPLKVYALGRFAVLINGKPARSSRKVQQKPLAVLKALIALGGKEVNEDEIMDHLWPEADGDLARQSFASALHRLRQLLGCEKAIQRQEGRLTLDDRFCWVDAWAFEACLEQAEGLWKKERAESAVQLLDKAMQMYRGPFLAQETGQPWTLSMRERLRGRFLRNVEKLGKYWQQSSQWDKALDCYLKGLEVDDLAEEFYQGVIVCYQQVGRKNDALATYKRYRKILSSIPGLEPSARIQTLYNRLAENREGEKSTTL